MQVYKYLSVLTINGSDCKGASGIQADLKTISALGCFGTSVVTAIKTHGVTDMFVIPTGLIKTQFETVINDVRPKAIKIGKLADAVTVCAIAKILESHPEVAVILDPGFMINGTTILISKTMEAVGKFLMPLSTLSIASHNKYFAIGDHLHDRTIGIYDLNKTSAKSGPNNILIKEEIDHGNAIAHIYFDKHGNRKKYIHPYVNTSNTEGAGDTLSSAIASYLTRGYSLPDAIQAAGDYVHIAIKEGANVSTEHGMGPLNHFFNPRKLARVEFNSTR